MHMKKFLTFILVLLIVLVLAAGGGFYAALRIHNSNTNYPNINVDGIPVGKLTREETIRTLNDYGWDERLKVPLTVTTVDGVSFDVDRLASGLFAQAEEMADAAYAFGREGNLLDNCVSYIRCLRAPENIRSEGRTADRAYLGSLVDAAIEEVLADVGDTEYNVDMEAEEITLRKGAGQIAIDREAFIDAIVDALRAGQPSVSYTKLSKELTPPDFQALRSELKVEPADAYMLDDGSFQVVDEIVGCDFDSDEALKTWEAADPAAEIVVPLVITRPEVTGQGLRDALFGDLLGACTTTYPNSGEARRSNLRLATSKIDGTILYPGDVFSYNETVGERTEEAGFQYAPAYVNGDVKDEIGGGACQVSSTLYAATLFAFLETVERENHYFAVNYMQLGTDATVTIPTDGGRAIDFKFKNSRNYPIKIVGYTNNEESSITFEIWGHLEDDDYMPIEFDNSWYWQNTYDRVIEPADPNREGYTIKLWHDTYNFSDDIGYGYRTYTWRRVIDKDGNVVFEEMTNLKNAAGQHTMDTYYSHDH